MKLAGSVLVLLASIGIALSLRRELYLHLRLLYEIRSWLIRLSHAAGGSLLTMEALLGGYVKSQNALLQRISLEIAKELMEKEGGAGEDIWRAAFAKHGRELGLDTAEQETVEQAGAAFFGRSVEENKKQLETVLECLDFQIGMARSGLREKQKVYGAVSLLGGVLIVIVLV